MATIILSPSTAASGTIITASGSAIKKTQHRILVEGIAQPAWTTSGSGTYSRTFATPLGANRTVPVVLQQKNAAGVFQQVASTTLTIQSVVTPPPTDVTAPVITNVRSTPGQYSCVISWDANEPCTGQVEYGLTPTAFNLLSVLEGSFAYSSHSQTLTGLTPGVTYYYRVKSKDAANNMRTHPASGALSFAALPATLPAAPTAPTLAASCPIGSVAVNLSWMPTSSPITEYRVYRGLVPNAPTLILTTGALTLLDTAGLVNGQTYSYQVSAVNAAGEGPKSAIRTVTPAAPRISNVTATSILPNSATIGWSLDEPGTGQVEYGTTPGYGLVSLPENSFNYSGHVQPLSGLTPDTLYYFRVRSADVAGNIAYSAPATFRTLASAPTATAPGAPTGLSATPGNGQISLAWSAPASNGGSAITNYHIYRNGAWLVTLGVVLSYVNIGLTNGQPYSYTVVAANAIGGGPASTAAGATPSAGVSGIYGPGIGFETKSNHYIGGSSLARASCRFRATQSSPIVKVAINQRFGIGYSLGNGGLCKLDVCNDSGGVPGGVIGTVTFSPGNPAGTIENKDQYTLVAPTPALVAGQFYHLVASNPHATPASNYFSINYVLEWGNPADPYPGGECTALYNTGGGWSVIGGETPVFDVQYANGQHDGQQYYEHSEGVGIIGIIAGTANMARVRFTVSGGNRTVTAMKIKVRRNSGSGALVGRLEYGDGTLIESVSVAAAGIAVVANEAGTSAVSWVTFTFTTPRTLVNGQTYNFRLSTAAGTQYGVRPIRWRDSSDTGDMNTWNGDHFRNGAGNANGSSAQKTTDGTNWVDLYPWDPMDLGFYFVTA